jgi:hypothetical protein
LVCLALTDYGLGAAIVTRGNKWDLL